MLVWRTDSGVAPGPTGVHAFVGSHPRSMGKTWDLLPINRIQQRRLVSGILGVRFHDYAWEMVLATWERDFSFFSALQNQAALWEGPHGPELKATSANSQKETAVLSPVTQKELNSSNKRKFGSRPFPSHTWDEAVAPTDTSMAVL